MQYSYQSVEQGNGNLFLRLGLPKFAHVAVLYDFTIMYSYTTIY